MRPQDSFNNELQEIIQECNKGEQISNRKIRNYLAQIASKLKIANKKIIEGSQKGEKIPNVPVQANRPLIPDEIKTSLQDQFQKHLKNYRKEVEQSEKLLRKDILELQNRIKQLQIQKCDHEKCCSNKLQPQQMQMNQNKKIKQEPPVPKFPKIANLLPIDKFVEPTIGQFLVNSSSKSMVIQYKGQDNTDTHFLLNTQVPPEQSSYRIKILKGSQFNSDYVCMAIGVVDYNRQKNKRCSFNSGSAICYWTRYASNGGVKYPGGLAQGNGFKEGDVVEIRVSLKNRSVEWWVNDSFQARVNNNMLADEDRLFVPYVQFYLKNTIVQWLKQ